MALPARRHPAWPALAPPAAGPGPAPVPFSLQAWHAEAPSSEEKVRVSQLVHAPPVHWVPLPPGTQCLAR